MAATEADPVRPDVLAIELAGMKAWPGTDTATDGSWVRRAAGGFTHRANSVQPLDPQDVTDLDTRIRASVDWFDARQIEPVFRVTPLAPAPLVDALEAQGWRGFDKSLVMLADMSPQPAIGRADICDPLQSAFLDAQGRLQGYSQSKLDAFAKLMRAVEIPMAGVVVRDATGQAVASALFAVADGIAVTGNVITDAAVRRQGLGGRVMRAGLNWASDLGARYASLNVAADNPAGIALYTSLGYVQQYRYVYYRRPA